ncbi:hypothetical protein [Streptomyces sp. NPDC005148]
MVQSLPQLDELELLDVSQLEDEDESLKPPHVEGPGSVYVKVSLLGRGLVGVVEVTCWW